MLPRLCKLPERSSCFLFGPRQTGKSTLVRSLLPASSWTVDLLAHDISLRYAKDPGQFRREAEARIRGGARTIFVDEVQKVPALLDEVHSLIEATKARFILTGSSARKLRRGAANLLAGRAVTRRLHPLTASEIGDDFDLDRALRFGTLPPAVLRSDDEAEDFLTSYGETYLREEVQAESLVRNLGGFARFLDVAAAQCGDILNYAAVGRDAMLASRTVREYFQILEDTLIGFPLEAWRKSPRARLVTHPRFYLFDTGVTNALNRRLSAPSDPTATGRLFEQWVVCECRRLVDYLFPETRLYYWRTNHGAEVDLLFERHGRLRLAMEIKSRSAVVGADVEGLRSFGDQHPKVARAVVCRATNPSRIEGIDVLPWTRFLADLERWLA